MPAKKYKVTLTAEERGQLKELISKGKAAARKLAHARILLACDETEEFRGASDVEVAEVVHVSRSTVERVRKAFVEGGLEPALNAKRPRQTRPPAFDGESEARLIALACSRSSRNPNPSRSLLLHLLQRLRNPNQHRTPPPPLRPPTPRVQRVKAT